jgi:hypothetical protein
LYSKKRVNPSEKSLLSEEYIRVHQTNTTLPGTIAIVLVCLPAFLLQGLLWGASESSRKDGSWSIKILIAKETLPEA